LKSPQSFKKSAITVSAKKVVDAMAYAYYYDIPPPLVDHLHERPHQHQNLIQYLAHRPPRPEDHPNQPDVDFRDATKEYLIEIEVPGTKKPSEITVSWTGSRSLLLTGNTLRPDYGSPENTQIEDVQLQPHAGKAHLLVGERRVGPFRRYVNFPTDVENVSVTLEAGLLKIRAPKKGFAEAASTTVDVKHDHESHDLPLSPFGGV
jgi:HSP20 family molecular chaperone IbpA